MNTDEYKRILELAVGNEAEAHDFYKSAAGKCADGSLKAIFADLADEEKKHKELLEGFIKKGDQELKFGEVADYKVSETVELPALKPSMSFVDGIALAMKKEEQAMAMYKRFADASGTPEQKETFLQLAKMEQGHKAKLEALYTNSAYAEAW